MAFIAFGMRETLPKERRVPFRWGGGGAGPLAFVRLFRRTRLAAKLNLCVLLQSLTNGMGDLVMPCRPFSSLPMPITSDLISPRLI
jgi:hypothetical protein